MNILVTGVAGFIGSNTAESLLKQGHSVMGIDNLTPYYPVDLKRYRLETLSNYQKFSFSQFNLCDSTELQGKMFTFLPDIFIHLAAQPGVRLPIEKLQDYVDSNLVAFSNVIQAVLLQQIPVFIYASSSSVYGDSKEVPFREDMDGIKPKSFYGATKLSNEILTSALLAAGDVRTRAIGLRLFTVYGPKGRPDMAYFKIANAFNCSETFQLFGDGSTVRDFTYVDDVSKTIEKLIHYAMRLSEGTNKVFNVGGGHPRTMNELIRIIADGYNKIGSVERKDFLPEDMLKTVASVENINEAIDYIPSTTLEDGIEKFISWCKEPEVVARIKNWI